MDTQAIKLFTAQFRPHLTWDELDVVIPIIGEYPYIDYSNGMFYMDMNDKKSHSLKREAAALKEYRRNYNRQERNHEH